MSRSVADVYWEAMFPGFRCERIPAGDVGINVCHGGDGPPLLLLHGYPQTHVTWHRIAPALAKRFTVICPDLRGYGDSDKPPSGGDHSVYCKRAMALDQVRVMRYLGFDRFAVAGHDRGVGSAYDVPGIWRERAPHFTGRAFDCGHFLTEERPQETTEALQQFLST
jgi:pimeloyl-ACP methyl ester carboxylesterase